MMKYKIVFLSLIVCGLSLLFRSVVTAAPIAAQPSCNLVVLAAPDDPYYALAEEIATAENAPLIHDLAALASCQPHFLLWVVAPRQLSDAVMIAFGQTMQQQPQPIATGIITASTIDGARALWQRRSEVRAQTFVAANADNPSALIAEGRIVTLGQAQTQPLTKVNFVNALQTADYVTFTGHGSSTYLKLSDEGNKITVADLPALDSTIIATGSCQTIRPWRDNSIALGFVDQGAAAYAGFVFSPNEGYLFGEFSELPFRYTWPDFPIGQIIQVQSRGALQGFAHFPFLYLLGDPRIALQSAPPYQVSDDHSADGQRVLTLHDVPAGVIPIRIPDGAAYPYVAVANGPAASTWDPFYNSRLQMIDSGSDKFVLLLHDGSDFAGGDVTLRLRSSVPWLWFVGDLLLDALDHTFIYIQQSNGDLLTLAVAIIPLLWIGWQAFKNRLSRQQLIWALALGVGATMLQGSYVLLRLDHVTVTSKPVEFRPFSLLAVFLLVTGGALMYWQARSRVGKVLAWLVITAVSWLPMFFALAILGIFNHLVMIPETGTALYNYAIGLLPAIAFAVTGLLFWVLLALIQRRVNFVQGELLAA